MQFRGEAFGILKNAYTTNGLNATVDLLIEYGCSTTDALAELYRGRFAFVFYKETCGDDCMIEITAHANTCLMPFKNRYDQQVDLDSLFAFDLECTSEKLMECNGGFDAVTSEIIITTITGHALEDLNGLERGSIIVVSNSTDNNGTYTIFSTRIDGGILYIKVAETLINEIDSSFNIEGCLFKVEMPAYSGLNTKMVLPPKQVLLTSRWEAKEDLVSEYTLTNPLPFGYRTAMTPFLTDVLDEIEKTNTGGGDFIDALPLGGGSGPDPDYSSFTDANPPNELLNFTGATSDGVLKCIGKGKLLFDFDYKFDSGPSVQFGRSAILGDTFEPRLFVVVDTNFNTPYVGQTTGPQQWVFALNADGAMHNFNTSFHFDILEGQTIWIWFDTSVYCNVAPDVFSFTMFKGGVWQLEIATKCTSTETTVYMVNETMSRCVEAYTNDCLRVYSDYYGRTDAKPYPSDADGCGALRCITNGLRIRNALNSDDNNTPYKVTVSMEDMFNALNAVDNIGMSLEDDPNRPGYKLVRIEPYKYFYNNDVVMECANLMNVERKVITSAIYSTIKTGYDKWKTWSIRGLNDIFTPREYRTELSSIKNELNRVCKFIASDYAIEYTRRQYGTTTADSRYDNDMFLLSLSRGGYTYEVTGEFIALIGTIHMEGADFLFSPGDTIIISDSSFNNFTFTITQVHAHPAFNSTSIVVAGPPLTNEASGTFTITSTNVEFGVERGLNNAENILDPPTAMNYRLAPSRNAMRWFKTLLMSYRKYLTGKLRFTAGEGNLLAEGEVLNDDACRLEAHPITENQDISLYDFDTPEDHYPLFWPEQVTFDYPMTYKQYLAVQENPKGLIGFQCGNSEMEYGWIEDMLYSPYNGMAKFTLRPKIAT
jgi:hypothetical protein